MLHNMYMLCKKFDLWQWAVVVISCCKTEFTCG